MVPVQVEAPQRRRGGNGQVCRQAGPHPAFQVHIPHQGKLKELHRDLTLEGSLLGIDLIEVHHLTHAGHID